MYVLMKKLKIKKNNPSVSLDNNGQQLKTGGGQTVGQTMSLCLLLLSSNQIQQHTTQVHNFKCFKRTNILVETTGCTVCTAEYETWPGRCKLINSVASYRRVSSSAAKNALSQKERDGLKEWGGGQKERFENSGICWNRHKHMRLHQLTLSGSNHNNGVSLVSVDGMMWVVAEPYTHTHAHTVTEAFVSPL